MHRDDPTSTLAQTASRADHVLTYTPNDPSGHTARIILHAKGIPYHRRLTDGPGPTPDPHLRAAGNGFTGLWIISTYLEERYLQPQLMPQRVAERAHHTQLCHTVWRTLHLPHRLLGASATERTHRRLLHRLHRQSRRLAIEMQKTHRGWAHTICAAEAYLAPIIWRLPAAVVPVERDPPLEAYIARILHEHAFLESLDDDDLEPPAPRTPSSRRA